MGSSPLQGPLLGSPHRPFLPALKAALTTLPTPTCPPESHLWKISWQMGEGRHGAFVGGVMGQAVEGVGGGPRQDVWLGLGTFQWPDMSEQEATTVPPGRRHSSLRSLVQVPGGEVGSGPLGMAEPPHPSEGQCPQAGDRAIVSPGCTQQAGWGACAQAPNLSVLPFVPSKLDPGGSPVEGSQV